MTAKRENEGDTSALDVSSHLALAPHPTDQSKLQWQPKQKGLESGLEKGKTLCTFEFICSLSKTKQKPRSQGNAHHLLNSFMFTTLTIPLVVR